ncbi:MAG TPA: hypothetical protein VGJ45_15815 [Pseudonocardiaceae bacterium]|jgi:hypothetical protein
MKLNPVNNVPSGLTKRAQGFVAMHGMKVDVQPVEERTRWWRTRGIPASVIDRMAAYQQRWGGLFLPPAPAYQGGPKYFDSDAPEGSSSEGWWFEAGDPRVSVPYLFMIGPAGEFGIYGDGRWTGLHMTVEGWVESVALAHHASLWAKQITKVTGDDVDHLALEGFQPVQEVKGLADTWWRGTDTLIAVYSGPPEYSGPRRTALIYSGLDQWGLRGGVSDSDD